MGEALFDLEQVLRSRKEKLTTQEENILQSWKSKALTDFTTSALAGGTFVWTATWKLRKVFQINLSAGAGVVFGLWRLGRSLYSCADHILSLDGSRLQKELANIMVTKYQNDPLGMRLLSKHFYLERTFDDSTSDNPNLRWRYRNIFSDNVVHGHGTHDHDSYDRSQGDSHDDSGNKAHGESEYETGSRTTNPETKHIFINAGPHIITEADPLDCLFGYGVPVEEIHHPNTQNKPPATHNRLHRRSHRRRRMRTHEGLSTLEHAAPV